MATKTTKDTKSTKSTKSTGQLNSYSEKLAKFAKRGTATIEQQLGGKNISTAGHVFTLDGQKTTEFEGVIVDFCNLKTLYTKQWTKDSIEAPDCYAVGYDASDMRPHEKVKNPVCTLCAECRWNKFGTNQLGKGKKCGDRIRIAIIKPTDIGKKTVEPYILSVPPTSLKSFAGYAKSLDDLGLAAQVVKTTFHIEGDDTNQFNLSFEMEEELGSDEAGAMLDLAERTEGDILFAYAEPKKDAPAAAPAARSKVTGAGRSKR